VQNCWLCVHRCKLNSLGTEAEHSEAMVDTCPGDGHPETACHLRRLLAGGSAPALLLMLHPFFEWAEVGGEVHLFGRRRKEEIKREHSVDNGLERAHSRSRHLYEPWAKQGRNNWLFAARQAAAAAAVSTRRSWVCLHEEVCVEVAQLGLWVSLS